MYIILHINVSKKFQVVALLFILSLNKLDHLDSVNVIYQNGNYCRKTKSGVSLSWFPFDAFNEVVELILCYLFEGCLYYIGTCSKNIVNVMLLGMIDESAKRFINKGVALVQSSIKSQNAHIASISRFMDYD